MAKYKAGDKVVIRKDVIVLEGYGTKTFVHTMAKICNAHNYILTIKKVCEDGTYVMEEDDTGVEFCWTDEMIEKLYGDTKFEAFLKEVVDPDSGYHENYEAWFHIRDLSGGNSKKENIQWLVDFYDNFVPKNEVAKKMTKAEIEAELGYSIEIVGE